MNLKKLLCSTLTATLVTAGIAWAATQTLTLGTSAGPGGVITLFGSTSGSATIQTPAVAGTGTVFQLPGSDGTNGQLLQTDGTGVTSWTTASGTGTVTSVATTSPITGGPITTTGTIACATCVTSAASLTSGAVMTGAGSQASQVDASMTAAAGALSLGASGTAGSVAMGNATSGTVTVQPVTGALGAVTASLPANTGTIAELNLNQSWTAGQAVTPDTATQCGTQSAAGTMTPNFALSNACVATFGAGNLTIANPTNVKAGQSWVLSLTQDGTGSRTVTWGANYKWAGGTAPTLSTTASAKDVISCFADTTTTINCTLAVKGAA